MQGKSLGRLDKKMRSENHQKIILFEELFLSSLLNAGTPDDGVMMASVGCILVLNQQKEVIQK